MCTCGRVRQSVVIIPEHLGSFCKHLDRLWLHPNASRLCRDPRRVIQPQLVHLLVIARDRAHAAVGRIRRDLALFTQSNRLGTKTHVDWLSLSPKTGTPRSISVPGVQMPSSTTPKMVMGILRLMSLHLPRRLRVSRWHILTGLEPSASAASVSPFQHRPRRGHRKPRLTKNMA